MTDDESNTPPHDPAPAAEPKPWSDYDRTMTESLEDALQAATHLTADDSATIQAARVLARAIEQTDAIYDALLETKTYSEEHAPRIDNVSIPTFLKYMHALGLTPQARNDRGDTGKKPTSKLGNLRSMPGGRDSGKRPA